MKNLLATDISMEMADCNGTRMAYFDMGKGIPLVMVHGWPQHSYSWRRLALRMADRFRIIALDLPGCGDSDIVSRGFDKKTLAGWIKSLVDHLALQHVVIVGHDWGGPIAYRFALDYPERTSKIIILNGRMPLLKNSQDLMYTPQQVRERWYFNLNMVPDLPEAMISGALEQYLSYVFYHWSGNRHVHDNIDLAEHVRVLGRQGGLMAGLGFYRTSCIPDIHDWEELSGKKIMVPHLVLWGALDPILPTEYLSGLETVSQKLQVRINQNAGHFLAEDCPDWVENEIQLFFQTHENV